MKSLPVRGLTKLVDDVIHFLTDNDCYFVPFGPSIRFTVLKEKTAFISGEVSCELPQLFEKCVSEYGPTACLLYSVDNGRWSSYRLEIGDASVNRSAYVYNAEPIVLHEWRSLVGAPPDQWGFTVDTLAIFDDGVGHVYAVDPTHKAFQHICDRKFAFPTDDWWYWGRNQSSKLLGFYELRSTGFAPQNESVRIYVNENTRVMEKENAQKFYCENVLRGVSSLTESISMCHIKNLHKEDHNRISALRVTMMNELGDNWNSSIGNVADQLMVVFLSDEKFVEIRNLSLHALNISYVETVINSKKNRIENDEEDYSDKAFLRRPYNPEAIEDDVEAYPVEIGRRVEDENKYDQQKSNRLPVMQFDTVDEKDLPEVEAVPYSILAEKKKSSK
uniref:Uncharacterized protein n=1 Tax=Caenorhabditis tropicalis TaxID=1561998 RepID=A0A1I7TLQ6_9PELO